MLAYRMLTTLIFVYIEDVAWEGTSRWMAPVHHIITQKFSNSGGRGHIITFGLFA